MRVDRFRVSIVHLLLAIAVVAGCLTWWKALLAPSSEWYAAFAYLRVGLALYATFLARYGRTSVKAWWFGFAAFGWASIAVLQYDENLSYKYSMQVFNVKSIKLTNVTGSLAFMASEYLPSSHDRYTRMTEGHLRTGIIGVSVSMVSAIIGGFVSLIIARREEICRRRAIVARTEATGSDEV